MRTIFWVLLFIFALLFLCVIGRKGEIKDVPVVYQNESKPERECRRVLQELFGRPFIRCRPDILRNPLTGKNLEFDGFCPPLLLAFEYNGKQHVHSGGRTKDRFFRDVQRDMIKWELAKRAGVYLIVIPHTVKMRDIPAYIRARIPPSLVGFILCRDKCRTRQFSSD